MNLQTTDSFFARVRNKIPDIGVAILLTLMGFFILSTAQVAHGKEVPANGSPMFSDLHIPFIHNQGQINDDIAFYAKPFWGSYIVTRAGELVLSVPKRKSGENGSLVLHERFKGFQPKEINGVGASETRVNVFRGNDNSRWRSGLPVYDAISLGEVFPGITVEVRAYGSAVEKLFTLKPGADPRSISMAFKEPVSLKVLAGGQLEIETAAGRVRYSTPVAYQEVAGEKLLVPAAYSVKDECYSFDLGEYRQDLPLVIDPVVRATFLGGAGTEYSYNLAVHPSLGKIYVTGVTESADLPTTSGAAFPAFTGGTEDLFIARLSDDLTQLENVTFLGGTGDESAYGIGIYAPTGEIYVAGTTTSADFPGTGDSQLSVQPDIAGQKDAFIACLDASLSTLLSATYLGGSSNDTAYSLTFKDTPPFVYVAGLTESSNFPGATGGAQSSKGSYKDGFIAKLSLDLSLLEQSTFIGGGGNDVAYDVAVHKKTQDIYVTGYTGYRVSGGPWEGALPGSTGGVQETFGGQEDVFVARFNEELTSLIQSTYLGGKGIDHGHGIVIDHEGGGLYVTGYMSVYDPDPTGLIEFTGGAQPTLAGTLDAFIAGISEDLSTSVFGTYFGGTLYDRAYGIERTAEGEIYIAGMTRSFNLPGTAGGAQETYSSGSGDAFVARFSEDLTQINQATYFGESGTDEVWWGFQISPVNQQVYISGQTTSDVLDAIQGAAQSTLAGSWDSFVARLSANLAASAPEACDSGDDEDGDGLIDCDDPDCDAALACQIVDADDDTIPDEDDNCPYTSNTDQQDTDGDGIGDVCDIFDVLITPGDPDSDDVVNFLAQYTQAIGLPRIEIYINEVLVATCYETVCEHTDGPFPEGLTYLVAFADEDGRMHDTTPEYKVTLGDDWDHDGVTNAEDNCVFVNNPDQSRSDFDRWGDECDNCNPVYDDSDFCLAASDAGFGCAGCPGITDLYCIYCCSYLYSYTDNDDQHDRDSDGVGDRCDACPDDFGTNIFGCPACYDSDGGLVYDEAGAVYDGGVGELNEYYHLTPDAHPDECQSLTELREYYCASDTVGFTIFPCLSGDSCIDGACVPDRDADGVPDDIDNCINTINHSQANADGDAYGDACDNCPAYAYDGQEDADGDGQGDACDCDDTLRGGDQLGPDCGGACPPCVECDWCPTNILPIRLRGRHAGMIDIVLVPHTSWEGNHSGFIETAREWVRDGYLKLDEFTIDPLPEGHGDMFNFYYDTRNGRSDSCAGELPGQGEYKDWITTCTALTAAFGPFALSCWADEPEHFWSYASFADIGAIVVDASVEEVRGCAYPLGPPSGTGSHMIADDLKTALHENGHSLFGLIDEYSTEDSDRETWYDLSWQYMYPDEPYNVWRNDLGYLGTDRCKAYCADRGIVEDCREYAWPSYHLPGYVKTDPELDMMNHQQEDGALFQAADYLVMSDVLDRWPASSTAGVLSYLQIEGGSFTHMVSKIVGEHPDQFPRPGPYTGRMLSADGKEIKTFWFADPRYELGDHMYVFHDPAIVPLIVPLSDGLRTVEILSTETGEVLLTYPIAPALYQHCVEANYQDPLCATIDLDDNNIPDAQEQGAWTEAGALEKLCLGIIAPDDITVECESVDGCAVDVGEPSLEEVCSPPPVVSNDAPSTFPQGVTIVTWTASYPEAGGVKTAQQQITVKEPGGGGGGGCFIRNLGVAH